MTVHPNQMSLFDSEEEMSQQETSEEETEEETITCTKKKTKWKCQDIFEQFTPKMVHCNYKIDTITR